MPNSLLSTLTQPLASTLLPLLPQKNPVSGYANRYAINNLVNSTQHRPYPLSMFSDMPAPTAYADFYDPTKWDVTEYISWQTLTDKTFSNRHLPPADNEFMEKLPNLDKTRDLFMRNGKDMIPSKNTSVLFMAFAQWFTDSFLRINHDDFRKNTSNHEIDLCQIYGLNEATTHILRSKVGGKLKSQMIHGQEFLPYLFDGDGNVKPEFKDLYYVQDNLKILNYVYQGFPDASRKAKFYVTGLERGNSTVSHAALNTLFMRTHNKVCDILAQNNPTWNDERLFQTTRLILIRIILRLVVEEYIGHISSIPNLFKLDTDFAEDQSWYRTNWISTEFDLLYRWHSLIPDDIELNNTSYSTQNDFRFNNDLVEKLGVLEILQDLSDQKAGKITIGNTPDFLAEAEKRALAISRGSKLRGFNEYRDCYSLSKLNSFEELTTDKKVIAELKKLYKSIDDVELTVGLFAEQTDNVLPETMVTMVAAEAFSHVLTNPVLSRNIKPIDAFSSTGWNIIDSVKSLADLVKLTESGNIGYIGFKN